MLNKLYYALLIIKFDLKNWPHLLLISTIYNKKMKANLGDSVPSSASSISLECLRALVSAISAKRLERCGVKAVRGGVADGEPVRGGEADGETVRGGEADGETAGGGEETGGEADVESVIGGEGGGARVETGEDWPVGKGRSTAAVRSGSKATAARIWSVGVGVCKWGKVPPSLNFVESY